MQQADCVSVMSMPQSWHVDINVLKYVLFLLTIATNITTITFIKQSLTLMFCKSNYNLVFKRINAEVKSKTK